MSVSRARLMKNPRLRAPLQGPGEKAFRYDTPYVRVGCSNARRFLLKCYLCNPLHKWFSCADRNGCGRRCLVALQIYLMHRAPQLLVSSYSDRIHYAQRRTQQDGIE